MPQQNETYRMSSYSIVVSDAGQKLMCPVGIQLMCPVGIQLMWDAENFRGRLYLSFCNESRIARIRYLTLYNDLKFSV